MYVLYIVGNNNVAFSRGVSVCSYDNNDILVYERETTRYCNIPITALNIHTYNIHVRRFVIIMISVRHARGEYNIAAERDPTLPVDTDRILTFRVIERLDSRCAQTRARARLL